MEDNAEFQQDKRIVQRKNAQGVVEVKKNNEPSKKVQVAGLTVAAFGLVAGARGMVAGHNNNDNESNNNDGAHVTLIPQKSEAREADPVVVQKTPDLFDTEFHDLDSDQKALARQEVDMYKDKITEKTTYVQEHINIPLEYESVIVQTALAHGITPSALMGLIGVENGGGPAVENQDSGALGVAQFLPDAAREYGLIVNEASGIDERKIPPKSIAAAGKYLEQSKILFGGDESLALWSYHAGPGNVYKALELYIENVYGEKLKDYGEAIVENDSDARQHTEDRVKKLIAANKITYWDISHNPVSAVFIANLKDYSASYVPSIVAVSEMINEYKSQTVLQGGGLEGRKADLGNGLKLEIGDKPISPYSH